MNTEDGKKLMKSMDQKLKEDRREIEEMTSFQLKLLADSLRNRMRHILDSASADASALHKQFMTYINQINAQCMNSQKEIKSRTIVDRVYIGAICLFISVGVFLGSLQAARDVSGAIVGNTMNLQQLESQIAARQKILNSLVQKTWGLDFMADDKGKWILLPVGMSVEEGKHGQQVALKLVPKAQ